MSGAPKETFVQKVRQARKSKVAVQKTTRLCPTTAAHHLSAGQFQTRVYLLARGVRGCLGVLWLKPLLQKPQVQTLLSGTASSIKHLANYLLASHDAESMLHVALSPNWASHCEGLHTSLSGRFFLEALSKPRGSQRFLDAAQNLSAASSVSDMVKACLGHLPLAVHSSGNKSAGSYNSMDVGRLYWLAQATCGRHVDLDSDGYLQVMKAQKGDEETMSAFGVTDYTAFMKLHDELATCSRNLQSFWTFSRA